MCLRDVPPEGGNLEHLPTNSSCHWLKAGPQTGTSGHVCSKRPEKTPWAESQLPSMRNYRVVRNSGCRRSWAG